MKISAIWEPKKPLPPMIKTLFIIIQYTSSLTFLKPKNLTNLFLLKFLISFFLFFIEAINIILLHFFSFFKDIVTLVFWKFRCILNKVITLRLICFLKILAKCPLEPKLKIAILKLNLFIFLLSSDKFFSFILDSLYEIKFLRKISFFLINLSKIISFLSFEFS